ncbi:ABC transporter ATP-binding protein [Brevibacterium sp. BRM-1]|uniref:ABC transporter ATP-binding protein n=1 Tax=Brevibacterium sp. BRM-1 TaxID=2999062 RepID=UPI002282355F|nr:ABC transporter ATP-binding protein [Brevibacterium sp. BRM-1]WAL41469.1 ABC transporter ATP-binding protein [Brevibacterium sp. BRM-1]
MSTSTDPAQLRSRAAVPIRAAALDVGYGDHRVLTGVDFALLPGELTVVLGPNACGKSTLLKALARVLAPEAGSIWLDGADIRSLKSKEIARRLGLLPQQSNSPGDITVADLVARGRYPHQGLLHQWSESDERAVDEALAAASIAELAARPVHALSGGQRQRVWIAMVLAQQTDILMLDEPTTYLDITHQIEVLDLAADLQRQGRTVLVVLHDLNLAFRYATHIVLMREGRIVAQGRPNDIVTAEAIEAVFGLRSRIIPDPETGTPLVVPLAHRRPVGH